MFWDWSELPEMQADIKDLAEAYKDIPITYNEFRQIVKLPPLDIEGMDMVWVDGNKRRVDEQGLSDLELDKAFRE